MNVVEEKIDNLNAVLRVKISKEDYSDKVEKALNDYRKQAVMPGFRPGKTPLSLIKKKYGKGVLADELNKAVNESLHDFISKNNINILGNPLPKQDEEVKGDFDNPADFEFAYEIGISPDINLNLADTSFDYFKIDIDKNMLDKEIENLARRYGKLVSADVVGERDMVLGKFTELDGDQPKEGGISNTSTISMEFISDSPVKKNLLGAKVGDEFVVDPKMVSKGVADMSAMLAISKEEAQNLQSLFNFAITEIKQMIPAEVNQELFDKIFGEGNVNSEDELRAKISEDLARMFANDSDRVFTNNVTKKLIEGSGIELPEPFLKRWIMATQEKISPDQLETEFESYRNSMKWQLIQGKLIQENDIKVEPQEAIDHVKGLMINQYAQYGIPAPADAELEKYARNALMDKQEANRIYDNLYNAKIFTQLKSMVKLNEKVLSYEKFIEEAYGTNK
ncbi:MAG: trigger factor [Crocinitomicaceae bacterium]|nr:trigger factor [Crocinitomicaceae bacterium]MBK8927660.1 trigger factor [Crocinitomicaceae bacterium]